MLAAKRAAASGASTVIASGHEADVLLRLCRGDPIGTWLMAPTGKSQARKQWMADQLQLRGAVVIDDGAVAKIASEGKSLLPIGMVGVQGDFSRGDVIAILDGAGSEVARGLANYATRSGSARSALPPSKHQVVLMFLHHARQVPAHTL